MSNASNPNLTRQPDKSNTVAHTPGEAVDAYIRSLVKCARALPQKEWQWGQFTRPDGAPIETVDHVSESLDFAARQSGVAELWGVNYGPDTPTICHTGNGPCSKDHAQFLAAVQPRNLLWILDELGDRIERLTRERDEAARQAIQRAQGAEQ